ncbi:uncharacterized protein LOC129319568 [Prosopis cineraria]|uniref:uncharacterized protein LOC129319568 n=1 Tax=Prosopis cineraria TaxID=364024 RepID=UPI00240FEDE2|nr:uncharacterized protein LOC129319568 [Prosopis cineraria]
MVDRLEDMICDVGKQAFEQSQAYNNMYSDAETPLYLGCEEFSLLKVVLELVNLKARSGWSDKSFTEMLELFQLMLPRENVLSVRCYEAKKILCPLGMEFKKIHACLNDCVLYRREHKEEQKYPVCETSRYKENKAPAKVLWYLPIIPRFKRLFANEKDAKNLRWHANDRISDGKLRHPADSEQWKKIDTLFPEFGRDPRNLKLGLSTDGMNSYSSLNRPKQPGNDIDVYLRPLVKDLKKLWEVGYSIKGHKACPICEAGTCYHQLHHGKKTVYLGHRRFLEKDHHYRRMGKAFYGGQEHGTAPKPLTGEQVYELASLRDGVKARLDLVDMKIKEDLHPRLVGKRTYYPPAKHTLCKDEKRSLLREIKLCGPVHLRWMYPIERTMKVLKGYVKSPHRPEASIVQKYVSKEATKFYQDYLNNVRPIGLRQYDVKDRRRGISVKTVDPHELQQAHLHILNNVDQVQDYIDVHKELVRKQNSRIRITEQRLIREHNNTFAKWFKQKVEKKDCVYDIFKGLAQGPECDVICWTAFDINGYLFYTKSLDNRSNVQNMEDKLNMDRSWIDAKRMSAEYSNGVKGFLEFAQSNAEDDSGRFYCPCRDCLNERRLSVDKIYEHLICEGFLKSYRVWIWHGERLNIPMPSTSQS